MTSNSNELQILDVKPGEGREDDDSNSLLKHAKLPSYLAEAFHDLYQEDGLFVCGRGLGLLHLIASFCRFYADVKEGHYACIREELERNKREIPNFIASEERLPLIFVIGLKDFERSCLISILERWGTPTHMLPLELTNESGQGKDRLALYKRGGIFLITSRILIVDLLTHIADPKSIDGILVAHAENVSEQSTEAFILRIFKTQKSWDFGSSSLEPSNDALIQSLQNGFVKAFTDAPDVLMSGFAKVDKILKCLFVRKLYLYPRFHESISLELERNPPVVEELHQTLSPKMQEIQISIAAAVKTCIREIKRATSLIEWADAELTLENCVTTNFDLSISRQLEHDWHRLKPSTKQLISDLRQLRMLFHYLLQYDCISFWRLMNNIKSLGASNRTPSLWLLTPAADRLFKLAKERMYTLVQAKASKKNSNPIHGLQLNLEVNPKWRLLHQVLSEIRKKLQDGREARILVMVNDERTLQTIKSYLVDGKDKTMMKRWLQYLNNVNERSRAMAKVSGGSSYLPEENRLLLEEEGRVRNLLYGPASKDNSNRGDRKDKKIVLDWKRKKRRINEEKSRGNAQLEDEKERRAILDEAIKDTEHHEDILLASKMGQEHTMSDKDSDAIPLSEEEVRYKVTEMDDLRVIIQTYTSAEGEAAYLLLNDVQPSHIVLYDADPAFIRSIEIHSACNESDPHKLSVYFMLFEASAEEKNYVKALEREQNAFEKLIQHKKTMATPMTMIGPWTTQEMQCAGNSAVNSYNHGSLPLSMDTRTGRGKNIMAEKRDIAVDVREFRSALPSILHQGGMRLAPATLTVGDYVLSNVHCVERKSISDLFGSFGSGRLYNQAETMRKHYKVPCLLIEFDPSKSFCLQNSNDIGPDIRNDSICSKMSLLVIHFPELRLIWSRSPYETLKIFKSLKANHEEVDVDKAIAIGSNESLDSLIDASHDGEGELEINEAARNMLLRLPGINMHNARKIMKRCNSISELAMMSRDDMKSLLGPLCGQKLFTFFNQKTD